MEIPQQYKLMDPKQKELKIKRVQSAQPEEKYRVPLPFVGIKFPEENFVDFTVVQDKKNIKLHTYRYKPEKQESRGVFIYFHGLNNHQNQSAHIAKAISEIGVTVVGYDFRGYGKSQGYPGSMDSLESHMQDAQQFVDLIEKMYPKQPIFLGGCSLGGMTSFILGLRNKSKYRGIVFLAPAIKDNESYEKLGKMAIKVLVHICPRTGVANAKLGLSSRNPAVKELEENDPIRYKGKILPITIHSLLNGMKTCSENFQNFDVPFLTIQGGMDKLVDEEGSILLMQKSPQKDKKLIYIEHMWHNIVMEQEITELIPQICKWIQERL